MMDRMDFESATLRDIILFLNVMLARFFFACNIPFRAVKNEYFQKFIQALVLSAVQPAQYTPCSRRTLSGTILERFHEELNVEKTGTLSNSDVVLLIYDWTNQSANRKYLVSTARNIHTDQVFICHRDVLAMPVTSDKLQEVIQESVHLIAREYKARVFAAITDNDFATCDAVRGVQDLDGKLLLHGTYSSHSANLIIQQLADNQRVNEMRQVVNFFRRPEVEQVLIEMGGTRLKMFPPTGYLKKTIEFILSNLENFRRYCQMHAEQVPQAVVAILNQQQFQAWLEETLQCLIPLCRLIDVWQGPKVTMAQAVQEWISLDFGNRPNMYRLVEQHIRLLEERAVLPIGYAANLLHPIYRGSNMNDRQRQLAHEYLRVHFGAGIEKELAQYFEKKNEYQRIADGCASHPITFWALIDHRYPLLGKAAHKLLLMPASTALIEGLYSNWTYIHNVYRDRLSKRRSGILLDLYYSLKNHMMPFDENDFV